MIAARGKYGYTQNRNYLSPDTVITVFNPADESQSIEVIAIFDTGAIMTCLPEQEIRKLSRLNYGSVKVRGVNDTIVERPTYIVDIQLGDNMFSYIEVVATPKNYGMIGRDILNRTKVTFNAPRNRWVYDCDGTCPIPSEEE